MRCARPATSDTSPSSLKLPTSRSLFESTTMTVTVLPVTRYRRVELYYVTLLLSLLNTRQHSQALLPRLLISFQGTLEPTTPRLTHVRQCPHSRPAARRFCLFDERAVPPAGLSFHRPSVPTLSRNHGTVTWKTANWRLCGISPRQSCGAL